MDANGLPSVHRGTAILVGLAAATVTLIGISGIRDILAPVLLALVLTICAHPVRTSLEKRGVSRGIATGSVILVVFALLAAFVYGAIVAVAQFATLLPTYAGELESLGASIANALAKLGIGPDQIQSIINGFSPSSILTYFTGILGSVFGITGFLVIVLTMLILMSADAAAVPTILIQLGRRRPHLVDALRSYASNVRRYMVVTTVLGVAQGVLNALALLLLHVPGALLWGVLAFLCSFIPNIGYFFALIPPLFFGFLVGGWSTAIAIVIIYGVINAVVQTIVQPRVVGNAVSLSQTITFFSVLFWAVIIGPIGAILAIPLTLFMRTILIDADPTIQWMRPAIGVTPETRQMMKAAAAAAKSDRQAKRAEADRAKSNKPVGPPPPPAE